MGRLKPVVEKDPSRFAVGGFVADARYSIYPTKKIGFLLGDDFYKAIVCNGRGRPFNESITIDRTSLCQAVIAFPKNR